jgi:hypothetical protein
MTDIRTLLCVEFVIKPRDGGAGRHIAARIQRLPDSHPDDARRGLETFRLSIQDDAKGDKPDQTDWVLPSFSFLKDHLTRQLHGILNTVDHNKEKVEVLEDTHGLIELQFCYCQFCGRKLLEHYGYLGAIVKICPRCNKYTGCADLSGRPKRF